MQPPWIKALSLKKFNHVFSVWVKIHCDTVQRYKNCITAPPPKKKQTKQTFAFIAKN